MVLTLNDEQYAYLSQFHEAVIFGLVLAKFFNDYHVIDMLEQREDYKKVFGDMCWDDVLDRYEEHPNFDVTLYRKLVAQMNKLHIYRG